MPNRLANESSPYLRLHADDPVGNVQRGLYAAVDGGHQLAVVRRGGVHLVKLSLLVAGHAAVEVLDGPRECFEAVGFKFRYIDYTVDLKRVF